MLDERTQATMSINKKLIDYAKLRVYEDFYRLLLGNDLLGISLPTPILELKCLYENVDRRLYLEFMGFKQDAKKIKNIFREFQFPKPEKKLFLDLEPIVDSLICAYFSPQKHLQSYL